MATIEQQKAIALAKARQRQQLQQQDTSRFEQFVSGMGRIREERGQEMRDIVSNEDVFPATKAVAVPIKATIGTGLDVIGSSVATGAGVLGDVAQKVAPETSEAVARLARSFLESDIAQAGLSAIESGVETYGEFKKENPNAAILLESLGLTVEAALPFKKTKLRGGGLDVTDSGDELGRAIQTGRQKFQERIKEESALFDAAKGAKAEVDIKKIGSLKQRAAELDIDLGNERLKPLADEIAEFESKGIDKVLNIREAAAGAPKKTAKSVNFRQIMNTRQNLSELANSPDGKLRNAAGVLKSEFDDMLISRFETAVISGDIDAMEKSLDAIKFSAKRFKDFGTNRRAGQNVLFEKVISNQGLDNFEIASIADAEDAAVRAFGASFQGKEATPEFARRLLDVAGDQRENVRQNLRNGFLLSTFKKSINPSTGLVNPDKLANNLTRLVASSRKEGGIGSLKDVVFTNDELNAISSFRTKIQNPSGVKDAVRSFASKLPVLQSFVDSPAIKAGKITKKQSEKFLSDFINIVEPELRGNKVKYGALVAGFEGLQAGEQ